MLVCAAAEDATMGICLPLCDTGHGCGVGECTHCDLDTGFSSYGVCLDAADCDGVPCPVAGCLG
jgi:hypothetical protein